MKEGLGNVLWVAESVLAGFPSFLWERQVGALSSIPDYESSILHAKKNPNAKSNLTVGIFSPENEKEMNLAYQMYHIKRFQIASSNGFWLPSASKDSLLNKLKEYINDINNGKPLDSLQLDSHGLDNKFFFDGVNGLPADEIIDFLLYNKTLKEGGTLKLGGCNIVASPETRSKFQILTNHYNVTIIASNVLQAGHPLGSQFHFKPEKGNKINSELPTALSKPLNLPVNSDKLFDLLEKLIKDSTSLPTSVRASYEEYVKARSNNEKVNNGSAPFNQKVNEAQGKAYGATE